MDQLAKFRVDCFTVAEIWPFFDFSWIFKSSKFLPTGPLWKVNMLLHAKFRAVCRDMANFLFFLQDGGRPPSWICFTCIWTTHEEYLLVFVTVQNFVGIGCSSFDNMPVLIFCEFGLKIFIHVYCWLVCGLWEI